MARKKFVSVTEALDFIDTLRKRKIKGNLKSQMKNITYTKRGDIDAADVTWFVEYEVKKDK